ncbi:MAG: hypothetical protein OEY50_10355 [Nitrospinota bacterium]|nr:hypothetical protein [Nitrospinota bacterium]
MIVTKADVVGLIRRTPHNRWYLLAAGSPLVGIQGMVWRGFAAHAVIDVDKKMVSIKGFFNIN